MKYFSGFSLAGEVEVFKSLLNPYGNNSILNEDYTLIGFSYGAILALEYAENAIKEGRRIERVILLSPAFFDDRVSSFKRLQISSFKKDYKGYLEVFYRNATEGKIDLWQYFSYKDFHTLQQDLQKLLFFSWLDSSMGALAKNGIEFWTFLGGNDKIINARRAKEFFRSSSEVWFLKDKNHCLM